MSVLSWNDAVDIGHGRGRLAVEPAASLRRVDATFGRPADVNEAWRSPKDADDNYAKYLRYQNGGPWAPIALPANQSVHCIGYALDTDDTSDAQMRVWNDHGWFWTVYRNGKLAERWHLEYFRSRDNHRNQAAAHGASPFKPSAPTEEKEEPTMKMMKADNRGTALVGAGYFKSLTPDQESAWGKLIDPAVQVSAGEFDQVRASSVWGDEAYTSSSTLSPATVDAIAQRLSEIRPS